MLSMLQLALPAYILLDVYYANQKMMRALLAGGHHLISRAKSNSKAYHIHPASANMSRGRPKKYGQPVKTSRLFHEAIFRQIPNPLYGETNVTIAYHTIDFL